MKYGKLFTMVLVSAMIAGLLISVLGCQASVSTALVGNVFYPDIIGKYVVGDPRTAMYAESGFGEGTAAGAVGAKVPGFSGMGGSK